MKPKQLKDEQIILINNEISILRKDIAEIKDKSDPDNIFDEMSKKVDQLIRLVSEIKLEMEAALDAKSDDVTDSSAENMTKRSCAGGSSKRIQCPKCRCPNLVDSLITDDPLSLE